MEMTTHREWRLLELKYPSYARAAILVSALTEWRVKGKIPNTFALITFDKPSVCLFYYSDPDKEIDLQFCRENDIEVGRRDTGGSPYWVDPGTLLFFLWFDRGELPGFPDTIQGVYKFLIETSANALSERFGIAARYRPLNDLEVQGRKIAGHTLIFSENVCRWGGGPQILKPRLELMSKALKPPPEKFADKKAKTVEERVTSLEDLIGGVPSLDEVKRTYISAMEGTLGVKFLPGELTSEEKGIIQEKAVEGLSTKWIMAMSEENKFGPQLPAGVGRGEHILKVPEGPMIRAVALMKGGYIENISITGSIHCAPVQVVEEMEGALKKIKGEEKSVLEVVRSFFHRPGVQIANCSAEDFTRAVMGAVQNA